MSNLVIVESPTKAKTIQAYLGKSYEVVASMGHIRDLKKTKLGVDLENNFEPYYEELKDKKDIISKLKKYAKKSEKIFLATDPDREGEAISWHLAYILNIDCNEPNRITFNEITKSGVANGMAHPRKIDLSLVNAQQARRILDRIVGYKLSPFLWRKIRRGLSAGRVQSAVVRLIVDRENEVTAFVPEEYWSIDAKFIPPGSRKAFNSTLYGKNNKKIKIKNKEESDAVLEELQKSPFIVSDLKNGTKNKSPAPPFKTSTLQQEAAKKLNFQSRKTMKVAQELYEGIDVAGHGSVGLITYMRTDSLRISKQAVDEARELITTKYGEEYYPKKPNFYKSTGNAQDAHEAIRPSTISLAPDSVKSSLSNDQYKLYKLIWERFVASQMSQSVLNTTSVKISAGNYIFTSSGYNVKFKGFTILYEETEDENKDENTNLPPLQKDVELKLKSLDGNQHFTQPPARFTEHSLIKALEDNGIGRPSTYSPTITTIIARNYVERDGKSFKPTSLGIVTTQLMKEQFEKIVDYEFTANMEKDLDLVETGEKDWVEILGEFYSEFENTLQSAEEKMSGTRMKVPEEPTDIVCELCGKNMVIKIGRFGKFLACPGFPECKNTKKITQQTEGFCPKCGGKIEGKKSKKGKVYYGCEKGPGCDFMTWDAPIKEKCPECQKSLLKKKGKLGKIYCSNPECHYERGLKD